MLSGDMLNGVVFTLLAGIPTGVGLWLCRKGILRERYFLWVVLPSSLFLGFLAVSMRSHLPRTAEMKVLASFIAAVLVMTPVVVGMKTRGFGLGKRARKRQKGRKE